MDGLDRSPEEGFTPADRIHRRREFEAIYSRGSRIPGRYFVLFILPSEAGRSRLGVTLSRKVGNAVVRNRARRRMREIFRRCPKARKACLDIIVHARPDIADAPMEILRSEFLRSLDRFAEPAKPGR